MLYWNLLLASVVAAELQSNILNCGGFLESVMKEPRKGADRHVCAIRLDAKVPEALLARACERKVVIHIFVFDADDKTAAQGGGSKLKNASARVKLGLKVREILRVEVPV